MEQAIEVKSKDSIQKLEDYAMSADEILEQVKTIQNISKAVMQDNVHYGKIPGCGDKPTLLKPGAEKLILTFRLSPKYDVEINDMGNEHREYEITCNLESIITGVFIGSGLGCCSTMESKFRYRTGEKEVTETPVPKAYWDSWKTDPAKAQAELQKAMNDNGKFSIAKDNGKWFIAIQGEKKEHDNPADYYNTVKKIAKKRALVDAVLSVTGASDIFTQDIEDLNQNGVMGKKTEQKEDPAEKSQTDGDVETNGNGDTISQRAYEQIVQKLEEYGIDGKLICEEFNVEDLKDILKVQHGAVINKIAEIGKK